MPTVTITCPTCNLSREMPAGSVPDRTVQVTCPRCRQTFTFSKPAVGGPLPPAPEAPATPPPRQETPPPSPASVAPAAAPVSSTKPHRSPAPPAPMLRMPAPAGGTTMGDRLRSAGEFCRRRWLLLGGLLLLPLLLFLLLGTSSRGLLLSALTITGPAPPARQVITIPPAAGDMPAGLPSGSISLDLSSSPTPSGTAPVPADSAISPSERMADATDLSIFIYAVNAPGTVRVNGREFKVIKDEPDMQYNINTFGDHFRYGGNSIEFDVTPQSGEGRSLSPQVHMKVTLSRGSDRTVIGEWRLSDSDGWPRSVTLDIPKGK